MYKTCIAGKSGDSGNGCPDDRLFPTSWALAEALADAVFSQDLTDAASDETVFSNTKYCKIGTANDKFKNCQYIIDPPVNIEWPKVILEWTHSCFRMCICKQS